MKSTRECLVRKLTKMPHVSFYYKDNEPKKKSTKAKLLFNVPSRVIYGALR